MQMIPAYITKRRFIESLDNRRPLNFVFHKYLNNLDCSINLRISVNIFIYLQNVIILSEVHGDIFNVLLKLAQAQ